MGACSVIWALCGLYFFSAPAKPWTLLLWMIVGALILISFRGGRNEVG